MCILKRQRWKNVFKSICRPPYGCLSKDELKNLKSCLKKCDAQYVYDLCRGCRIAFSCKKVDRLGRPRGVVSLNVCEDICPSHILCHQYIAAKEAEDKINESVV